MNKVQLVNLIQKRRIIIIAGSNGAGKTTFAREFLPKEIGCPVFVNADLIAAGLSPFEPASAAIRAGSLMIAQEEWLTRVIRERIEPEEIAFAEAKRDLAEKQEM